MCTHRSKLEDLEHVSKDRRHGKLHMCSTHEHQKVCKVGEDLEFRATDTVLTTFVKYVAMLTYFGVIQDGPSINV